MCIVLVHPLLGCYRYYLHFTHEDTEAQRGPLPQSPAARSRTKIQIPVFRISRPYSESLVYEKEGMA